MWNQVSHLSQATQSLLKLVSQAGQTVSLLPLIAGEKEPSITLSSDSLVPTLVPRPRDALVLDPV